MKKYGNISEEDCKEILQKYLESKGFIILEESLGFEISEDYPPIDGFEAGPDNFRVMGLNFSYFNTTEEKEEFLKQREFYSQNVINK